MLFRSVNGYRIVSKGGKYGLMNKALDEVFAVEYDKIEVENEGIIARSGSNQKLYDFDGKTILQSFVYDRLDDLHYNSGRVSEDGSDIYVKSDFMSFDIGDKVGLMDKNGHVVVPAIYEYISAVSNDLFSCRVTEYGYLITINSKGQVVQ